VRLARPFYRLPVRFDDARLRAELASIPRSAWAAHPSGTPGNSALRLLSVDGGENDEVNGTIAPTPVLARLPYVRQVLASFGVVWSRSRCMRLAPGAQVVQHADINYHWHYRVRIHIPVVTRPEVQFHCADEQVHMAAGETWIFDSWRQHWVDNPTDQERIHLVADTTGSAAFWRFVALSMQPGTVVQQHSFRADWDPPLRLERVSLAPVMAPAEVELLLMDMRADLAASAGGPQGDARVAPYAALLDAFCRDWRQLYLLHGERREAWESYAAMRRELREASRVAAEGVIMRSNGVHVHRVLEARVLRSLLPQLPEPDVPEPASRSATAVAVAAAGAVAAAAPAAARPRTALLERPLFIIAAPRSGSTLLYETLAASRQLANLGGEAPWLVEDIPELRPGAPGIDSNRLLAEHATRGVSEQIRNQVLARLLDADGNPVGNDGRLRLLEKTPKNALRVPFLERIFPDARFVLLWREPRENLSSIIEAWRAGRWVTYNRLAGFVGPWSLLLPPGWAAMSGRPLGEIAAFQWQAANRIALDDLQDLPPSRWTVLNYTDLVADPAACIRRICHFAGLAFDSGLANRLVAPLPLSRYTQSPPAPDKWLHNAAQIDPLLPALASLRERLAAAELSHQSGSRAAR
jgi:hypothetical protein